MVQEEEIRCSQLADNIIVYEKNPEECTKKAARTK